MKIDELKNEEMYVLVAPDGTPQLMTLAPDYAMCVGVSQMLAKYGISKPIGEMFKMGYEVMPVKVTIQQNGDAETAFQKAKRKYSR